MQAGKLIHRVTILRDVLGDPSPTGERRKNYVEFARPWTEVRTLAGREIERARTLSATVTHTVRMRYMPGIGTTFRVLWDGRTLNVNAAIDAENTRRELVLYCTEEPTA